MSDYAKNKDGSQSMNKMNPHDTPQSRPPHAQASRKVRAGKSRVVTADNTSKDDLQIEGAQGHYSDSHVRPCRVNDGTGRPLRGHDGTGRLPFGIDLVPPG